MDSKHIKVYKKICKLQGKNHTFWFFLYFSTTIAFAQFRQILSLHLTFVILKYSYRPTPTFTPMHTLMLPAHPHTHTHTHTNQCIYLIILIFVIGMLLRWRKVFKYKCNAKIPHIYNTAALICSELCWSHLQELCLLSCIQ